MKRITLIYIITIWSFISFGQSVNNTPFRFANGLYTPNGASAPSIAVSGGLWFQPSTFKLAIHNGTVWQNLLTETLATTTYNPLIAAGTTTQYYRGDKTFQTLNTTAVPEGTNLYATNARSLLYVLTGYAIGANTSLAATDTYLGAFQKLQGQISANVSSIASKQNLVTLTTTGSGAATFNQSTGALNIPTPATSSGTVTSVAMTTPTGLTVTGSPITTSGTLAVALQSGYSIPTTTDQASWTAKQPQLNGTGFVKASGTTISYDNSTYYLASNPNGYTSNTGTVTNVSRVNGYGISASVANPTTTPVITIAVDSSKFLTKDTYQNLTSPKRTSFSWIFGPNASTYTGSTATDLSIQQYNGNFALLNANSNFPLSFATPSFTSDVTATWRPFSGTVAYTSDLTQVVEITGTTQTANANTIYIPHNAALTTITAPSATIIGSLIQVVGEGAGGWRINFPAGYTAKGVGVTTSSGGSISSTDRYCTITLRLVAANTFVITSSQGTLSPL